MCVRFVQRFVGLGDHRTSFARAHVDTYQRCCGFTGCVGQQIYAVLFRAPAESVHSRRHQHSEQIIVCIHNHALPGRDVNECQLRYPGMLFVIQHVPDRV